MAYMSEWASAQPAYAVFHPTQLKIKVYVCTYFFDIVIIIICSLSPHAAQNQSICMYVFF